MTDDEPKDGIEPPRQFPDARLSRAILKAAGGAIPFIGSAAAEVADEYLPDPEARDRSRWEGEITEGVNTLSVRVDDIDSRFGERKIKIAGATAQAAEYIAKRCPDGLHRDDVTVADLQSTFPEVPKEEWLAALGDLESYGLLSSRSLVNAATRYRLTQVGYEALDKPIMGWDTDKDARKIAAEVVKKGGSVRSAALAAELDWPKRRFNPALRIVVDFIGPGRVSQTCQPDYVTAHFTANNAELATLRRFAAGD